MKNNDLQLIQPNDERITAIDEVAKKCGVQREGNPFANAIITANGIAQIQAALTPEVMQPIMLLQGSALGFRTDKPYPENIVKDALIEATLRGVAPVGNEFNIIAGRCYITKEGFGHLLAKLGLKYMITTGIPKIVSQGAEAPVHIEWEANGERKEKDLTFPIKVNSGMGADAINGKATRKARAWLYAQVTGMELADGDTADGSATGAGMNLGKPSKFEKKPDDIEVAAETAEEKPFARLCQRLEEEQAPVSLGDLQAFYAANRWEFNEAKVLAAFPNAVSRCIEWKQQGGQNNG